MGRGWRFAYSYDGREKRLIIHSFKTKKMAKKAPKKPKAPRATASLATWENYKKKVSDWEKEVKTIEADKKKKAALIAGLRRK